MKRILLAAAAVVAAAAVSPALADDVNIASTDGTAAVRVFQPITVTQTQGLDFGAITSGAEGKVAMTADGVRSAQGGVGLVAQFPGQAGSFDVTGEPNAVINVAVASSIDGFKGGIKGVTVADTLPTALKGNSASFNVGGSLYIPANTPAGSYTGSYKVAVNYP